MQEQVRSVARVGLAALQVIGTLYVALFCWLIAAWMVDDSWAFRAAPIDWWRTAATRLGFGILIGAAAGLLLVALNKLLARAGLNVPRLGPWQVGLGAFAAIVAASAIGALYFAIRKPYM
jgi:hypothetical protein